MLLRCSRRAAQLSSRRNGALWSVVARHRSTQYEQNVAERCVGDSFPKAILALQPSVEQSSPGEPPSSGDVSPVWRHSTAKNGLFASLYSADSLWHAFELATERHGDRPCFGTRDTSAPEGFTWRTYSAAKKRMLQLGAGLLHLGVKSGDAVGIYARNRDEWLTAELSLYSQSCIPVAIYDTLGPDSISYCINHANIEVLFCDAAKLSVVKDVVKQCPNLKHAIVFDGGIIDRLPEKKLGDVHLHKFVDVLNHGVATPNPPKDRESTALIMYTSGTTGTPKGVVHTHRSLLSASAGVASLVGGNEHDVHLSYLPLAHIFERVAVFTYLQFGAAVGFFGGDMKNLLADIQALKPTALLGVPRVFEKIDDGISARTKGWKGKLLEKAVDASDKALKAGRQAPPFWTKIISNSTKALVGGRVRYMLSGGAPLAADTHRRLRHAFGVPLLQGYGLTETCAIATITHPYDAEQGHAGAVVPCAEIRLKAVPEMGYKDASKDGGEVQVKGPCLANGYHEDEERTKADFGSDGWFSTGDIGRFNPNGTLKLIDRKKNMFKTSLGEYIAAEKLETEFKKAKLVQHVLIHGDEQTPYVLAACVLEPTLALAWAASQSDPEIKNASLEDLARMPAVKKAVLAEFNRIADEQGFMGFERPRAIVLDSVDWTIENDLMTPSFKLKRQPLRERYQEEFDSLYSKLIKDYKRAGETKKSK